MHATLATKAGSTAPLEFATVSISKQQLRNTPAGRVGAGNIRSRTRSCSGSVCDESTDRTKSIHVSLKPVTVMH
jgi:hypothetical protein